MNTRPNIVGVAASQSRHATFFFFLSVFSTSSLFFPSTLSHHTQQRTAREWVSECVCMCMNGCAWASVRERERERERERARDRIRCTALAHKKSCCLFCCCRCCSSLTLFIESFFEGKLWKSSWKANETSSSEKSESLYRKNVSARPEKYRATDNGKMRRCIWRKKSRKEGLTATSSRISLLVNTLA